MIVHRLVWYALVLALSLVVWVRSVWAQSDARPAATPERIAAELKQIESAANWHPTDGQLGRLWEQLASDYQDLGDVQRAEDGYGHALKLLRGSSSAQRSYAITLDDLGSLYLETGRLKESENCRRQALAVFEKIGDPMNSAAVHGDLAVILLYEGRYKEVETEASEALEGMQGLDANASQVASALLARDYARCALHRCMEGLADARQAMDVVRTRLRPDSLEAVAAWIALGYALWKTGDDAGGGDAMREALRILHEKRDLPYPVLVRARVGALRQYAQYLNATHRKAAARQVQDEIASLQDTEQRLCNNCTVNVVGLSSALR